MVNENSIRSQADIDADLKVIYGDARYVPKSKSKSCNYCLFYQLFVNNFSDWSCHQKRLLRHLHKKEVN